MEYAKLFFNDWFKRPIEDQRQLFREQLNKEWWENATEEEKKAWYDEEVKKKQRLNQAKLALGIASSIILNSPYKMFDNKPDKSKYW